MRVQWAWDWRLAVKVGLFVVGCPAVSMLMWRLDLTVRFWFYGLLFVVSMYTVLSSIWHGVRAGSAVTPEAPWLDRRGRLISQSGRPDVVKRITPRRPSRRAA